MSLDTLRDLRRRGQKPADVLTVVIGQKPRWMDDEPALVVVRAADDPRFMDWRPTVGLWVAVFDLAGDPARFLAVLAGLHDAGVKFFGAANPLGVYPMTLNPGPAHEASLAKTWELLCRS